ncbi:MAG: HAD family hydrolase [Clostridiales bacterium]|nr:HAD family hydrolase [Clostridiales bacterium]
MDKIRAVFTDLDGTVLRNDKTISERTMKAIRAFREEGGIWAVASARPERAISAMYKEFTEADALITLNGARIRFGDTVISNGFSRDAAVKALSAVLSHDDLIVVLETSKGIFGNIEIPEWDTPAVPDLLSLLQEVDLYKILIAGKEHKLFSVTIPAEPLCPSDQIPERIKGILSENGLSEDAYFTVAEGWLFQIMSTSATKWSGVKKLLEREGIPVSEAAYFGDDHDDVESIRNIGYGVAMGNAIEEVKNVADTVTGTNEEDGVAKILDRITGSGKEEGEKPMLYYRVHTADIAYITQQPRGIFTAVWKLVEAKLLTEEEEKEYWKNRVYFEEILPVPPFYEQGNPDNATTWFKDTEEGNGIWQQMDFYRNMCRKYGVKLYRTECTELPGEVIYEDAFQIAIKNTKEDIKTVTTEVV